MATTHRIYNLIAILLPFVGLFAAMAFAWGYAFDWIHLTLFLAMYLITGLGVTIGFHRYFSHKSFNTGNTLKAVLGILGSMSCEGPIISWVRMHRCHHQHSDQPQDPHTPYDHRHTHDEHHDHRHPTLAVLDGIWRSHLGWMIEPKQGNDYARYTPDLDNDPIIQRIDRLFPLWAAISLGLPALIAGLVTMSWTGAALGFLWGGLVRVLFVQHITWCVNSICHIWGTKPYKSNDESRNNPIVGVLALGEGWHNNHHAFPTSARHGLRWWQFDISYIIIQTLAKFGVVWDVRVPTPERLAAKRLSAESAPDTGASDRRKAALSASPQPNPLAPAANAS